MADAHGTGLAEPEVGSYFVANYPPFSVWTQDAVAARRAAGPRVGADSRCAPWVCTCTSRSAGSAAISVISGSTPNKNAQQVEQYLDWLVREWELRGASRRSAAGRSTSSISAAARRRSSRPSSSRRSSDGSRRFARGRRPARSPSSANRARCSGTSSRSFAPLGVTRLSLGVENFDDALLELNGRAHRSPEIGRAYDQARALGFPQINIDLIAGMLGETGRELAAVYRAHDRAGARQRDHLPDGAAVQHDDQRGHPEAHRAVQSAGRDVGHAAALGARSVRRARGRRLHDRQRLHRGEEIRRGRGSCYRDRLWEGADLVGLGVASFGHVNGVHVQNVDTWETYGAAHRPRRAAARPRVSPDRRRAADPRDRSCSSSAARSGPATSPRSSASTSASDSPTVWKSLAADGFLERRAATPSSQEPTAIGSRSGAKACSRVDSLLHRFFLPEHRGVRYT